MYMCWTSENLSSGSPTKQDSNKTVNIQRQAGLPKSYHAYQRENNIGNDRTACMRNLVWAFVVRMLQSHVFSPYEPRRKETITKN